MKTLKRISLFSVSLFLLTGCNQYNSSTKFHSSDSQIIEEKDIIYFDDDGSILKTVHDSSLNSTYSFEGIDKPTKPNDLEHGYQFSFRGWERIPNQDGHICFKAVYDVCTLGVEFKITKEGAYVKDYKGNNTNLYLPDYWNAKPVIGIKENAFQFSSFKEIKLPENLRTIDSFAFPSCINLKYLLLPNSVETIGDYAFFNCKSIQSIQLSTNLKKIGAYSFAMCTSFNKIQIPSSVLSIGEFAFTGCSSLKKCTFEGEITQLNVGVFSYCKVLTQVNIPETLTIIPAYTFFNCTSLETISLPYFLESIMQHAFDGCEKLASIEINDYLNQIGDYAFSNCKSLKSIIIPNSVTNIGTGIFKNCTELYSIEFFADQTTINLSMIENCTSLTKLYLPSTPDVLDNFVYISDSIVTDIYFQIDSIESFLQIKHKEGLMCNVHLVNKWGIEIKEITIPPTIDEIPDYAFVNCNYINSISFPNTLKSIGKDAFYNCTSLRDLTIPISVTEIKDGALDTLSYTSVTFTISSIDQYLGYKCKGNLCGGSIHFKKITGETITEIEITQPLTSIKECLFLNCVDLTSIKLPSSITEIGEYAFRNCSSLEFIEIPDHVTTIGNRAFSNCPRLTSIVFPNSNPNMFDTSFLFTPLSTIYFKGDEQQWNATNAKNYFSSATVLFYAEDETDDSNFWHYVDGKPAKWVN